ncbi:MAG: nucleoside deaminase [Clostridiaceae bacterium]
MDIFYREALNEAKTAYKNNEVPVGCIIVKDGEIIGRGHNAMEGLKDPSAHAEVAAIREAANALGTWRLNGCIMYVTLEPCLMCASLTKKARIQKVVIGAIEYKEGAFGSAVSINDLPPRDSFIQTEWLMDVESENMLKNFFKELRKSND